VGESETTTNPGISIHYYDFRVTALAYGQSVDIRKQEHQLLV